MKKKQQSKILVAMSGGVDSSVAAMLLKEQGHDVTGIFLHFWKDEQDNDSQGENKCCSTKALADARMVAEKIGIPLYTMNFSDVFKDKVVDYFLDDYAIGKTPNPCVACNKKVKMGLLLKRAKEMGFDCVASGHYARIVENEDGKFELHKGVDTEKDQSYFLYRFDQDELKHLLFPLGNMTKPEVRKLAKKYGIPVAEKKDSNEICFISGKSHNDFLKRYLEMKPGDIKTLDGETVGRHLGLPLYTIGQRKGVEIGGTGPYYVAKFDFKSNILFVTGNGEDPSLYNNKLVADNVNWIDGKEPKLPLSCEAIIRYRHRQVPVKITKEKNKHIVYFKDSQRAITPGQSVVFYDGEKVLGGGTIT